MKKRNRKKDEIDSSWYDAITRSLSEKVLFSVATAIISTMIIAASTYLLVGFSDEVKDIDSEVASLAKKRRSTCGQQQNV